MMKEKLTATSTYPQAWAWWHNDEPKRGVMGYFRCDYGDDRWWNTVWPVDSTLETPELVQEFDRVLEDFREDFPTLDHAKRFCREHATHSEDDE